MKKINVVIINNDLEPLFNVTVDSNCLIGIIEEDTKSSKWEDLKLLYSNKASFNSFDFKWISARCKALDLSKKAFIKNTIQYILFILIAVVLLAIFLL